ncbi:MAG: hypothetical protein KDC92_10700 [Bacteroidetes bacterium]|nr:hypothetical protein [Bacteroidota bacterium]
MNKLKNTSVVILGAMLLSILPAKAQYNNLMFYNNYFKTTASFDIPTALGTDIKRFSLDIAPLQFYAGNTAFSAQDLYDVYYAASDTTLGPETQVGYLLQKVSENTKARNRIYAGINAYPLNFAFKIHKGGNELLTFGLFSKVVGGANFSYGGQIFDIIRSGNGAYAGENINLGNFGINSQVYQEIGFGAAFPVISLADLVELRAGFRIKQLVGIAAIQTAKSDILLYTQEEGKELVFEADYMVNTAFPPQEITPSLIMEGIGRGIGIDAGLSGKVLNKFDVSISMADIGGIRYANNDYIRNYRANESYTWRGLNIDFDSLESALSLGIDTVIGDFELIETDDDFRMPIATRLVLNGSFGLGQMSKKNMTFYRHNFYFTYIQGFTDVPGNSTIPFVNGAYSFNLANILTVGSNIGYGGSYGFNMGAFVGLNLAVVRMGFGTNSLFGALAPSLSRGVDFSFNLAIAF